jgi:hypothetical protein
MDHTGAGNPVHIIACAASGKYLFVGSEWNSVYYSTDNGATWTWIPVYQSSFGMYMATAGIAVIGNYVFTGSQGVGVYRLSITDLPVRNPKAEARHSGLWLTAAPAGGAHRLITVSFSLPSSEQVLIRVTDIAGRQTATLADNRFGPGAHSLTWDVHAFHAGVYMVSMQAGPMKRTTYISVFGNR